MTKKMTPSRIAKALGADRAMSMYQLARENRDLRRDLEQARAMLDEHERLFELQHRRSRHAEILWREAHGEPNVMPDLGALLEWLIDRGDRWQSIVSAARAMVKFHVDSSQRAHAELHALRLAFERYDEFWNGAKF